MQAVSASFFGLPLFARQSAELGQVADEGTADDGADPGDRSQQIFLLAPHGTRVDVAVKVLVNVTELALEPPDVLEDTVAYGRHRVLETIALGHQHPEDLAPPRQQAVESMGRLIGQRARLGPDALGEEGQGVSVDPIGLGQLTGGAREVAHLAGIGHDQRQPGGGERGHRGALVSARRLQDYERRSVAAQTLEQPLNARFIIGGGPALPGGTNRDDELSLRDVDADEHRGSRHSRVSPRRTPYFGPALRDAGCGPRNCSGSDCRTGDAHANARSH